MRYDDQRLTAIHDQICLELGQRGIRVAVNTDKPVSIRWGDGEAIYSLVDDFDAGCTDAEIVEAVVTRVALWVKESNPQAR